ncbi:hypothetical protein CNMCM8980_007020 [Aspergillus fumigatiaffinis]|nr:hypothetical protein CNMCM8980_007020 [Aspergillus fumigatiaffinis]
MHSWVQRPDEERHQEVLKRHGRIPRPLNSFMLYRSAYADRAKLWTAHDNHQTVSVITGLSWNIETPQIRRMYKNLAKIEKRNHARAHPGYHFTVRKRRERSSARRHSKKTTQSSAHLLPKLCQASDTIQHPSPRDVGKAGGYLTQSRIAEHEPPIAGILPWAEDLQRSHIGDLASCDWPPYFPNASFGQEPTQSSKKNSSLRLATLGDIQPSPDNSGYSITAICRLNPPRLGLSSLMFSPIQIPSLSSTQRHQTQFTKVNRTTIISWATGKMLDGSTIRATFHRIAFCWLSVDLLFF